MNTSTTLPMPVITVNNMLTQGSHCRVRQVRPWVRYFARFVDLFLFSLLAGFVLGMYVPSVLNVPSSFLTVAILFVWIFQEAVLLANCGTTPGKWLFKIKVTDSQGQKLKFSDALNRSFGVGLKGMGGGVPLLPLLTLLGSKSKLKRDGVTVWDEDGGFLVTHSRIGILRSAVAAILVLGFFSLGTLRDALEETEDFTFGSTSGESQKLLAEPTDNIAAELEHRVSSDNVNKVDIDNLVGFAEKWLENQSGL
ncbi:MAG: RDD family protein [Chloroflexi bacterium]|nr:RDD family protein [Chloroflexota bacterium]